MELTEKDLEIHAIADSLISDGLKPTLANIRQALGGGSYTTISESMKLWNEKQNKQKKIEEIKESAPDSLKDGAIGLINESWRIAQALANDRLKSEREALDVARGSYENQVKEAGELADALSSELETANESLNVLTSERDALDANNRAQSEEIKEKDEEIKSLTSLEIKNETEIRRLGTATESLRIDVSTHKSRADELEKEKIGSLLIIKELNVDIGSLRTERDAEITARNTDRAAYEREIKDFKAEAAKSNKERESAIQELSRYKDKALGEAKEMNASYIRFSSKIEEMQRELGKVQRERDSLELELAKFKKTYN